MPTRSTAKVTVPARRPPRRSVVVRHVPAAAKPLAWSHRELAVVLGIVGFLALTIMLAVDPVRRLNEVHDAIRLVDVRAIANAVVQVQSELNGPFSGRESAPIMYQPEGLVQVVVADDGGIDCGDAATRPTCGNLKLATSGHDKSCVANIAGLVPKYLAEVPVAPGVGRQLYGAKGTGYYVARRFGGVLEIGACDGEAAAPVMVQVR